LEVLERIRAGGQNLGILLRLYLTGPESDRWRKSKTSQWSSPWNFSRSETGGSAAGRKFGIVIEAGNGLRNEKWEVAGFINNVTDEVAFLALDQERGTLAGVGYLTNTPRSLGVTVRINF